MTEFRPGGFQVLPVVIKNLLIINGLVFLAQVTFEKAGMVSLYDLFALHDVRSPFFRPHQFLTHMFLHGGFDHILFNMFALWMFGSVLENYWGPKRFIIFYLACGLGAAFLHMGVLYYENSIDLNKLYALLPQLDQVQQQRETIKMSMQINQATVGASGAIFGCLAAFGYLFPNSLIYLYFFIPIKAKWFVLMYAAMEFFMGVRNSAGDNVAHWAHLGGALVGFLLVLYWNKTNRRRFY